jgi:nucleoside-diphosphate-sugar epimerase
MEDNSKKILVTGASGLIGRELCRQLSFKGHTVIGVDNNRRFGDIVPENCQFVCQDLSEFYKEHNNNFDLIFHLAAVNGTSYFYSDPNGTLENNVRTDLDTFQYVLTNLNCKLIYSSSSEVVAGTTVFPTDETVDITIENIHNPRWSYRLPKILSENYLTNSNINYLIVRFFNVFGSNSGSGHFVKDIVEKIKNQEHTLIGADETRSFCYVEDAVDALIHLSQTTEKQVVNIGNDREVNILEAANIIALEVFDKTIDWKVINGRQGSVSRRSPSINKLKELYPTYSPRSFRESIMKIKDSLK